jgi:hypothetical protein
MEIDIDVTPDLGRFAGCYSRASGTIHREMRNAMNDSVRLVENSGKANAPVKTGTLRRSITSQVRGAGGSVSSARTFRTRSSSMKAPRHM